MSINLHYEDVESDIDVVESDIDDSPKPKCRSSNINYIPVQEFPDENSVQLDEHWKFKREHKTSTGLKKYYYCNEDRKNCRMGAVLLYDNTSEKVFLSVSDGVHCHTNEKTLPLEVKAKIDELLSKNVTKPKAIMEHLRSFPKFKKSVLTTYLRKWKKKKYGPSKLSLSEFQKWCEENKTIPADDDTPYSLIFFEFNN